MSATDWTRPLASSLLPSEAFTHSTLMDIIKIFRSRSLITRKSTFIILMDRNWSAKLQRVKSTVLYPFPSSWISSAATVLRPCYVWITSSTIRTCTRNSAVIFWRKKNPRVALRQYLNKSLNKYTKEKLSVDIILSNFILLLIFTI